MSIVDLIGDFNDAIISLEHAQSLIEGWLNDYHELGNDQEVIDRFKKVNQSIKTAIENTKAAERDMQIEITAWQKEREYWTDRFDGHSR